MYADVWNNVNIDSISDYYLNHNICNNRVSKLRP